MSAATLVGLARSLLGETLADYLAVLVTFQPRRAILASALAACLGLSEVVGLLLVVPLLGLVGLDVRQGAVGPFASAIAAGFGLLGIRLTLPAVLGAYALVATVVAHLARWQVEVQTSLTQELVAHLRRRLFERIARTNWLFFTRSRPSDFTHVLTAEIDRVAAATHELLFLLAQGLLTTVFVVAALRLSAPITGLVLGCAAGLWWFLRGGNRTVQRAGEQFSRAVGDLYAVVAEHLSGMKIAKGHGTAEQHVRLFGQLAEQVAHLHVAATRAWAAAKVRFDLGAALVLCLLLYVAIEILATSTADLLVLLLLYARLTPRFGMLLQAGQRFLHALPAFAAYQRLELRCAAETEPRPARTSAVQLRRAVRFENVSFSYAANGQPAVLDCLDLVIPAGRTTAIVGPSGAGKTTVADLLTGLLTPTRGGIFVDDAALGDEHLDSWRHQIGYVTQDTFLLNDTVRANLCWARPDASEAQIRSALRLAAAEELVSRLPDGLETVLGDRGIRLSGGERQRLALARALVREPALLVLDEATSNLDSENERKIQQAIERLHGQVTILVIAHRLATIRGADLIYVLEHGRLVERGAWDALLGNPHGRFRALYQAQRIDTPSPVEYSPP